MAVCARARTRRTFLTPPPPSHANHLAVLLCLCVRPLPVTCVSALACVCLSVCCDLSVLRFVCVCLFFII